LNYISLRYFNAAGADPEGELGEDHTPESHLIPLVIRAALTGNSVSIYGTDYDTPDGTCIRDYIHVTDLAQAHILGLQRLEKGEDSATYNLGNGSGYSVKEVIETARKVTGMEIAPLIRREDPETRLASWPVQKRSAESWDGSLNIPIWKRSSKQRGSGIKPIPPAMKTNSKGSRGQGVE
jgi:UDP-glucose 4-epimerase